MDLYIDRDELSRGLARVQGIVERRSTHPVLSHVLLHAQDEHLRITATDTEVAYIGELKANVEQSGEWAVEAANLFQVVRNLPDKTVHLTEGAGQRLELRSGRSFFRLPAVAATEFPPLPAFDAQGTAIIEEGVLRRLIEQTSFAVATDDARYGLNGAHVEQVSSGDEQHLRMVATDGHRLAAAQGLFVGDLAITPRMLLPRKALSVLKRLLEGGKEPVQLSFGDGAVRLSRPGQTFWFRLLDGEFPDYKAVLPAECRHTVTVRRDALASTVKRVGILVQDRTRAVRFSFSESEVEIQLHNVDRGEVVETVPIELEGDEITVGFNVRYLQDILGSAEGEHVQLQMAHPLGPCMLRDPDHENVFFVVMPMRLD